MSEITMTEKDVKRLAAMAKAISVKPESASEFLNYAYGLGYCEGRIVTAKQFAAAIDEREPQGER